MHEHIGDLKIEDSDGNILTASTNFEKAKVLGTTLEVFLLLNQILLHQIYNLDSINHL